MLADRLARLSARYGVVIPDVVGDTRLGLAGTIRVAGLIPLRFTHKARAQLLEVDPGTPEHHIAEVLNGSNVWTWGESKDKEHSQEILAAATTGTSLEGLSLLFQTDRFALRCVPAGDGRSLLVIGAQKSYRPKLARLLVGDFTTGLGTDLDVPALARMIAAHTFAGRLEGSAPFALQREAREDRELLIGARRYLEAVRQYALSKKVTANYIVSSADPLQIEPDGRSNWPKAFTRPGARLRMSGTNGEPVEAMISDMSDDGALELETRGGVPAESGQALLIPDDGPIRRMYEAIDSLLEERDEAYPRLLTAIARPESLPAIELPPIEPGDMETRKQREALALALTTPDVALIHGPPGTGKTTVICQIVEKLVKAGLRVLLVAPTHVALDNALERVGRSPGVIAIRLGDASNVDPEARRYRLPHRARDLGERLLEGLRRATKGAPQNDGVVQAQIHFRDRVESQIEVMGSLLLRHANLVCATPVGIAQVREFRDVDTVFDVMIIDEASKATLADFLVPAVRARKWILVGDHKQLAPYVDVDELAAVVSSRAQQAGVDMPEGWAREVAVLLRKHFDLRMHPSEERRRRVWEELLDTVLDAFPETEAARGVLLDVGEKASDWRSLKSVLDGHGEDLIEGLSPETGTRLARLMSEMFELRDLALKGIFEHLVDLPPSRQVRLDHQFRMAPALAELSCARVYGGDYRSSRSTTSLGLSIPTLEGPSLWLDTSFVPPQKRYEHPRDQDWSGGDYTNDLEIAIAHEVVTRLAEWGEQSFRRTRQRHGKEEPVPFEIGVVCFYLRQARRLMDRLRNDLKPGDDRWRRPHRLRAANGMPIDIHVSVVDRFQGREKDVVILCTTRSNPNGIRGHVDNLNRLNVAITRARHKRIVIGDAITLSGSPPGKKRGNDDLLRALYEGSERKVKWGRTLVQGETK